MSLIDVHTHAFPTAEMGYDWQTVPNLPPPHRGGLLSELAQEMEAGDIERAVVLLFPRSGEHFKAWMAGAGQGEDEEAIRSRVLGEIRSYNRWGVEAARQDPRFVAFVGVNVRYMNSDQVRQEIRQMAAAGARGVKVIPPSMGMYGDDELLRPVFETAYELDLPVLSQSGDGFGEPPFPGVDHWGRPRYHRRWLEEFPGITIILAHLGHGYADDVAELARDYPNLYTDTSFQFGGLVESVEERRRMAELIRRIGVEKVLFGTNFPMTDPSAYARILDGLPLAASEKELVGGGNARRALKLGG